MMMTEVQVLHSPSSPSSPSIPTSPRNVASLQTRSFLGGEGLISRLTGSSTAPGEEDNVTNAKTDKARSDQLSLLAILVTLFRKSFWMACKTEGTEFPSADDSSGGSGGAMEIGWPTEVQHVNHVTFDRFNGFLGLPAEFEPEVPRRAPSASATIFGVSTESMQLSYDSRGNSVPTILLRMQRHLYSQGGLQVEGIFRITAGNSQEEYVRDQLNRGVVPQGVDVHCLAGLMKAWFRELPRGILDSLSPERVMQCQSEDDCHTLVRLLPQTEAALLDWAVNLMADVVQEERANKMNARNIAMVFAPNMTQMADPLTALMYAVQVMNFLKTLIEKALRGRGDSITEAASMPGREPLDEDENQDSSRLHQRQRVEAGGGTGNGFFGEDPGADANPATDEDYHSYSSSTEESSESTSCETTPQVRAGLIAIEDRAMDGLPNQFAEYRVRRRGQSSYSEQQVKAESRTDAQQAVLGSIKTGDTSKGIGVSRRVNSVSERFEEAGC